MLTWVLTYADVCSKEYGDEVSEDKELVIRCTAEFIGTFFLVLTVGLNVLKGGVMDPEVGTFRPHTLVP